MGPIMNVVLPIILFVPLVRDIRNLRAKSDRNYYTRNLCRYWYYLVWLFEMEFTELIFGLVEAHFKNLFNIHDENKKADAATAKLKRNLFGE